MVASRQIYDASAKAVLSDPKFFLMLRESITTGWKRVLGEGSQSTFYFLELVSYVQKPIEFHKKLYSIFGQGSLSLEKVVILDLFQRLNLPFRNLKRYSYADYVFLACRTFVARKG